MPRMEYFIVCRAVSADIHTDELTLSQVVEDLFPETMPEVLLKIVAVGSWQLAPDEVGIDFQAILKVAPPGKDPGIEFSMNLSRGRQRFRTIMGVLEIPLDQPGDLTFELLLNGKHAAMHIVTVHPPGTRIAEDNAQMPSQNTGDKPQG
jgi:hypothetical protein